MNTVVADTKTCQACRQPFSRRPAPHDSAFRWMRRKFCSQACSRARAPFQRPAPRPPGVG